MSDWKWTKQREQAALLVAEDEFSDEAIAASLKINRGTLVLWKATPEFAERAQEHVKAFAAAIRNTGIGRLENRVARLDRDWRKLRAIVEARAGAAADEMAAEAAVTEAFTKALSGKNISVASISQSLGKQKQFEPGLETGLIVRKETFTKTGRIVEYAVDTGLLGELRAMEMQAAKELGQIVDRAENREYDMRELNDPELDRLAEGDPIERVFADSRRRRAREAAQAAGETGEPTTPPPPA